VRAKLTPDAADPAIAMSVPSTFRRLELGPEEDELFKDESSLL